MLQSTPKLMPNLAMEQHGEVIAIYDTTTKKLFITNRVGQEVLELCDGSTHLSSIIARLIEKYGQHRPSAEIERDVIAFLTDCLAKQVVQ